MKETLEQIRQESLNGYTQYSGIELTEIGDGSACGLVRICDHHRNPSGAIHGGIIFCLGDVIGGIACRMKGALPVTVSSSISYMRPMLEDQVIYARAEVVKAGRTTTFVDIRILNEREEEAARMQAVYCNMSQRAKEKGRQIRA